MQSIKRLRLFFRFAVLLQLCFFTGQIGLTQVSDTDAFMLRQIYDEVLENGKAYDWLTVLSEDIGGRLSGSPQAAASVEYTRQVLEDLGCDSVWLQACMVPHWVRGEKEEMLLVGSKTIGTRPFNCCALGNSPGTGPNGLTAEVVEVKSLDDVEQLGEEGIKGKIVFYNRPMDNKKIRTFHAYGSAVDQRVYGPAKAAEYGAVAAIVRSMTTRIDDIPHTGVTRFPEGARQVPALAISTKDAELLASIIQMETPRIYIRNTSEMKEPVRSHNVIGEIRGSEYPDEILLVGGHLDSWDLAGGAHDDGSGCMQSLEVIRCLKAIGYQPRRTIRAVMFMNEENGLAGGLEYTKVSGEKGEFHLAALESDSGGFTPRSISFDAKEERFTNYFRQVYRWNALLEPYGIQFEKGGSGADINPLKGQGGLLMGLRTDSQRYFDYHHTALDRIDAVNERELHMGAAAMASIIYLIDKYGLNGWN